MFRIQTSIEDLQSTKEMEDYSLTFQRVYQYNECRASLQKEIDNHLKYIMCNEKKRSFINEVFVVEATKKMPNEIMDFDYIYVSYILPRFYQFLINKPYFRLQICSTINKITTISMNL